MSEITGGEQTQRGSLTDDWLATVRRRLEALTGYASTEGNAVDVYRNGDRIFPAMLDAIRHAERTVDLMTYIYWKGTIGSDFTRALSESAANGVRVRLLIDAVGGLNVDRDDVAAMKDAGVHLEWFRVPWLRSPFKQNHRCHRKVMIVDEQIAFTGGVGISDRWCGDARNENEWRDTHIRVRGPAVDGLRAAFVQDWAENGAALIDTGIDLLPSQPHVGDAVLHVVRGSASLGYDDLQTLFRVAIGSAQERVRLSTAYFTPSTDFRQLLITTAQRGVEVDVLLPGPHADKSVSRLASESVYEELVEGGVRVWNFQPTMLHVKTLTVDRRLAVIGSANFNRRSMDHDEEVVVAILNQDVTAIFDKHFEDDLERSEPIDPARWERRRPAQKLYEAAVMPLRRWL
ncbi:MAG: phospholipase D-like domain-containing protein [Candidatus Nanopelagicales bacterium]